MDVNSRTIVSALAIVVCGAFSAKAQNAHQFHPDGRISARASRDSLDSLVYPAVLPEGKMALRFDSLTARLGKMKETDAKKTVKFSFVNVTDTVQRITKVRTTCGCTLVKCDKMTLKPGEKGTLTLTFNPKNQPGKVDVSAFLYTTHSKRNPMARITLTGMVEDSGDQWRHLPVQMGNLRLKRKELVVNVAPGTKLVKERIAIANAGETPLTLKTPFLPQGINVCSEPATIPPGEEADLLIEIDMQKLSALAKEHAILIEGLGGRPSERIIKLKVKTSGK